MNEADGEAPSKIHCRGEARNPGFEVLLQQTHVNRCLFALEHRIIYSQIATALSLPWAPSAKPRRLCSSSQNKQHLEMNPHRRQTATTRREASPAGETGGSIVGELDLGVGGSGGSGSGPDSACPSGRPTAGSAAPYPTWPRRAAAGSTASSPAWPGGAVAGAPAGASA